MKRSKSIAQAVPARFVRTPVVRLLQISTGMLLIGSGAAWAQTSGTPCDARAFWCTVTSTNGQSAPPAPSTGFDESGHSGGNGSAAGPVNITISGAPGGNGDPSPWYAPNDPPIQVQAIGGSGADGGTASNGDAAPTEGLAGGNGGQGAAGGTITLTVPQGAPVQVVGLADPAAIQVTSQGGSGGGGALASFGGISGTSSSGAQGGDVNVTFLAAPVQPNAMVRESTSAVTAIGTGILAQSIGGNGGNGHSYNGDLSYVKFGIAGADSDGPGGNVTVNFNSSIAAYAAYSGMGVPATVPGAGIWAVSAGGNGGNGGKGESTDGGQGGQGGDAANGGAVSVNVQGGTIATLSGTGYTPAVWAQSLGGIGGAGGSSGFGSGGDSGAGGDGGSVSVNNDGALSTATALHSPGILAQSFGGAGPNGGQAGAWGATGGEGATGGNGGAVLVTGSGSIQTSTRNSPGVLAQSIGGGGGNGGDSNGWLAVGGVGGNGGNGGSVQINSAQSITTTGASSAGIMAQAIGGGGGNGGNATGTGLGVNLVIGGSGTEGGSGGTVAAYNSGTIVTSGQHSSGMELQSVGGGGGKGGAAFGKDYSGIFGAQESVGGAGGAGGGSGWVSYVDGQTTTNSGIIRTSGSDSFGIIAQSIGGGGGIGAASVAQATTYAPDDTPSLSMSLALGGKGGSGGDASSVQVDNSNFGLIATTGAGAAGMVAQSVGGGGGAGGDASASSTARGSEVNISASVTIGGAGGGAGDGNWVVVGNSGLIVTTGESADGMLVQSIGGGGGNGGSGDSSAKSSGDGTNISGSATVGGAGGGGGNAYQAIQVSNSGALLTLGDGAAGIVAQAIGGGGGRAGGAAGTSNGDFAASVNIGGSGGSGGSALAANTTSVQVANSGSIVTFGADAPAIAAQSIGGGGGMGGKSASSLGGKKSTGDGGNGSSATSTTMTALQSYFQSGYGNGNQYTNISTLTTLANQLLGNQSLSASAGLLGEDAASDASGLDNLGSSQGDEGDGSNSTSITANVEVGGKGGSGGSGGVVQVSNTGSIGTVGAMSDGILAQSIGGGGGKGGAATSSGSAKVNEDAINAPVAVGGSGGVAGVGSAVTVTNGDGTNPASVITIGSLANAIVAQSIGGGGGIGGVAGSRNGLLSGVNVSGKGLAIGGDSIGTSNDANTVTGGAVTVTNSTNASIQTMSHDAIGIVAQSIGGGGGIVKTLSTDASDNNGGASNPDPISISGKNAHDVSITFGGSDTKNGSNGSGGTVSVTNSGSITTAGRNAYGMLAQSIGGGGGLVQGGEAGGGAAGFMNAGPMRGNGGDVTATTNDGSTIATSGAGAVGIFAQSVGGGGGVAGDTGLSQLHLNYSTANNHPGSGNGGTVTVNVNPGSSVETSGPNAPAVIAQSVGGGGGYIVAGGHNTTEGLYAGSYGGSGVGGPVVVNIAGLVSASGAASPGVYAQSSQAGGASASGTPVTVNVSGVVSGGTDYTSGDGSGAGVQVYDGMKGNGTTTSGYNLINNNGVITSVNHAAGTAVFSSGNTTLLHNGSQGIVWGSINLIANGGNGWVQNDSGGQLVSGTTVAAVAVNNDGVVDVGGQSAAGATTEVTGQLTQSATGKIVLDSDHVAGTSDRLTVDGNATLGGAIQMRPARLSPTTVQAVDVKGQLDASQLQSADPMLVHYQLSTAATTAADGSAQQSVFVTPQARFDAAASGLGKNAQSVASHLQSNFNAGSGGLGAPLAQLANNVQDPAGYKAALTSLGNEAQQAVGTSRLAASHAFVERMNSCPTFDQPQGTEMKERDCAWGRIIDNSTTASGADRANYHAGTHSVQVGGQKEIAEGWFLGGSAAYDNESYNSSTGAGSVDGNGGALGIVLKREVGNWTISGAADLGYGSYDTTRNIAFPGYAAQASGAFNLTQMGLHSRIAYLVPQQNWYLKPYLDLHAVHMHSSSYAEQGAGALGLNVNGNSDTMFAASPMLEVGGRLDLDSGMTVRPYAAIGGTFHDKNEWGATAQFQGAAPGVNTFDTAASAPTSLANVRLGVNVQLQKNLELKAEYGGQFGSGYRSNEGILRVNYLF